ncbi:MAG: translation initiation factor IF-2 [Rhizobiales bacterium NRL2]|jgi:translation initiation factor IF-2|nr:MAG: translation initiation factor IF-2 [Rhizobiales bacterium NRL2]
MTDQKQPGEKKTLTVSRGARLELKKRSDGSPGRQGSGGRSTRNVQVEVKKKRSTKREPERQTPAPQSEQPAAKPADPARAAEREEITRRQGATSPPAKPDGRSRLEQTRNRNVLPRLTEDEKAARAKALKSAQAQAADRKAKASEDAERLAAAEARRKAEEEDARRQAEEEEARRKAEEEEARQQAEEEEARRKAEEEEKAKQATDKPRPARTADAAAEETESDESSRARKGGRPAATPARPPARGKPGGKNRRSGKLTISQALDDTGEKQKSLAAFRRRTNRDKRSSKGSGGGQEAQGRIVREVVVPEALTVGELANRMAVRGGDVVKAMMKMGVMATINQTIDADTAELVIEEFGHRIKRVSETDVEDAIVPPQDVDADLKTRPAVVTVMGHVDHGKTSVLDALRKTDVVRGEAGGITQHIGAYQVTTDNGQKITFLDTPGHAAFTSMRSRGAKVTDIVVLVVAADDSVMPQTVEAIHHAQAAGAPIIIAVNKIDKPDADPSRVKQDLLQHNIVVEEMGGEQLVVEISALKGTNLDSLVETIVLQAELMDLKANPDRTANGTVIEAQLEQGRGAVATVLVQGGTLKVGDIFVSGATWGRVRALVDEHGERLDAAEPSRPVEVLGYQDAPSAGDDFIVVDSESRAREVAEVRARRMKNHLASQGGRGTLEQMLSAIKEGQAAEVPILIKGDVQGSVEAIVASAEKMSTDEVKARILHAGVGGITETDVTLAKSAGAVIFGFNARPNKQAREAAERDGVDIRYYNVIYELTDDLKAIMSGLLEPESREINLGTAEVRQVFNITKVGKIAGCLVVDGTVKRNAKYRQLRDGIVLHEGTIANLKHFKEEVAEVRQGSECGIAFQNHQDIQDGDQIEVYEIQEIERTL